MMNPLYVQDWLWWPVARTKAGTGLVSWTHWTCDHKACASVLLYSLSDYWGANWEIKHNRLHLILKWMTRSVDMSILQKETVNAYLEWEKIWSTKILWLSRMYLFCFIQIQLYYSSQLLYAWLLDCVTNGSLSIIFCEFCHNATVSYMYVSCYDGPE